MVGKELAEPSKRTNVPLDVSSSERVFHSLPQRVREEPGVQFSHKDSLGDEV